MKDILVENLMSKYSKLHESFWNPCPEFQDFEELWFNRAEEETPFVPGRPSNWDRWNQAERDAFADEVVAEYLKINPTPTPVFFNDLEDSNYHTAARAFDRALKGRVNESCGKKSKKLKESLKEIDRQLFGSLQKETTEYGHYYILVDGNYEKDFYADSDEEAKEKFRKWTNRKNESCKKGRKKRLTEELGPDSPKEDLQKAIINAVNDMVYAMEDVHEIWEWLTYNDQDYEYDNWLVYKYPFDKEFGEQIADVWSWSDSLVDGVNTSLLDI